MHNHCQAYYFGTVVARKKGWSCQGVKYVFDAHTSNASKMLKVVLLYLWRTIVKHLGGFSSISSADLCILLGAHEL
jgi:hypothetical protein